MKKPSKRIREIRIEMMKFALEESDTKEPGEMSTFLESIPTKLAVNH